MNCISIAPRSMRDAILLIKKAVLKSELIEIRLENIENIDLSKILKASNAKNIITIHPGGKYNSPQKFKILKNAIEMGIDYIDVGLEYGEKRVKEIVDLARSSGSKSILSYHNFTETPNSLEKIFHKIKKFNPDIVKIAVYAKNIEDNLKIFKLLEKAEEERVKLTALCMGEHGAISRILAPKFGNYLNYFSLGDKYDTASGQLTIDKANDVYRFNKINRKTKIYGLVGNPVSHSKGIYLHNNKFYENKINSVYINFLTNDFNKFIRQFKKYISGISVTKPFKEKAVVCADKVSIEAAKIKSINTVVKIHNILYGYNTDALALLNLLKKIKFKNGTIAVLGTGGTTRTAVYCAKKIKNNVIVCGRNTKKTESLADEFDCQSLNINLLSKKIIAKNNIRMIINTTSCGMYPNINTAPISTGLLNSEIVVVDFIYTPINTKLIKNAIRKGCRTINGLQIFIEQASLQQKLFSKAR